MTLLNVKTMPSDVEQFYDSLASVYHLIFEDWDRAMGRQGRVLDTLLRAKLGQEQTTFHDSACGIGTQAIGLATLGHRVSGSDLSPVAVQRAKLEAMKRQLDIEFRTSDMTKLAEYPNGGFDAVGALDNALPHLSPLQLQAAVQAARRVLRSGGLFLASIRDYDDLIRARPTFQGPSFFGAAGSSRIVHQVWDWIETDAYNVHQYLTLESESGWEVLHFQSRYRCLLRGELTDALISSGFTEIEWLMPEITGYYQPLVTGKAPGPQA